MTTAARTHWAVKILGTPAGKGSMKCVGGKGGRHQLVNQLPGTKPWQEKVAHGCKTLAEASNLTEPIDVPVGAQITVTVDRPKSVRRPWPSSRGSGDVDKLARCVLDGMQDGGLIKDDAQVVELTTTKVYPDSDHPDVLAHPGVFIRIYLI